MKFFKKNIDSSKKPILKNEKEKLSNKIQNGYPTLKSILAPHNIDRTNPSKLTVNSREICSFIVSEFPNNVYIGWLDELYNYYGNINLSTYIFPMDNQEAIESITFQITQFEAQLQIEEKKGEIRNITRYRDMISGLIQKRRNIERGTEKLFQIQITGNITSQSKDELDKDMQKLESNLRGRQIALNKLYFQQDEGFKTTLPFGITSIPKFRNFTSGALTACFPFYNANILHETGIVCGRNMKDGTPVIIDFYDRSVLDNSNFIILGQSGSGKTYSLDLKIKRGTIVGIRTAIIDPEGEHNKVVKSLGGKVIDINLNGKFPNMFDIEEEEIINSDTGKGTGKFIVNLKEKISDLLNTIVIMAGGATNSQQSIISEVLFSIYEEKGINENPSSLYTEESFDMTSNRFYMNGKKKQMPIFSDFYNCLDTYIQKNGDASGISICLSALKMFKKGQIYGFLDGETEPIYDFQNELIVSFNISKIENNLLRPIIMHILMIWLFEKFGKKNVHIPKMVIVDEAWTLMSKNIKGHEYTSTGLEQMSRRFRKRFVGLGTVSQSPSEYKETPQGRAVLKQSAVYILFKQSEVDKKDLKELFNLSSGEIDFLMTAKRGEALVKINGDTVIMQVEATPLEHKIIDPKEPNPFIL